MDIVLPDRRVVVEVDGVFFHDKPGQNARDAVKDKLLAEERLDYLGNQWHFR